jgi:hypothetical protein
VPQGISAGVYPRPVSQLTRARAGLIDQYQDEVIKVKKISKCGEKAAKGKSKGGTRSGGYSFENVSCVVEHVAQSGSEWRLRKAA